MRRALSRIPLDTFLVLLVGVVVLAALLPARGAAADVLSVATKAAVALLFALYGARLSPQQAWHGVRQWKLHPLVLATTFVVFPLLGLGARVLVPAVLTPDLYTGLLFLCLVPSTVQSSIAFTSIARGHVSAAMVSASLSNILGVVLTPLLVVALMPISGDTPRRRLRGPRHRAATAAAVRRRAGRCGRGSRRGWPGMPGSPTPSTADPSC